MLDGLRQASRSLPAKILLGLLVISFAIWGVAGSFSGYGAGTIAQVGDAEVSAADYDRALRQRIQTIQEQTGQTFTMEQARALGIPQQVLSEVVFNAALQDQAADLNLGLSEDKLAETIAADDAFRGPTGRFDRTRFQAILRSNGLREDDYVAEVRHSIVRRQIAQALIGGIDAPQPMVKAYYQIQNEERTISFVTVGADAVEPAGMPDEASLQAYFEQNGGSFRAPEYRKLGLIVVDPASVSDPASVGKEEVAAEYERRKPELTRPERRRILQLRYDSREEAQAAADSLTAGSTFEDLLAARGLTESDIDLGMKAKSQIVDQGVAEAAFAAADGAVVPVLDASLGPAIIRVDGVEAGSVTPLAEAETQIRADLADRAARDRIYELHDAIEDERGGGATLQEAAGRLSLDYRTIDAVAADGTAPDGTRVDIPSAAEVVADAFASDVGVENDPVRTGTDGFVFYEVLETTPDRDRTLDEVRDQVVEAWQAEIEAERIGERAQALFERLQSGATIEDVAAEIGAAVETREGVRRGAQVEGLSPNAVAQAFAGPQNHVANADGVDAIERILLRVDAITVPAFFDEAAGSLRQMLGQAVENDVLQTYNSDLLQSRPPRINNAIYAQLTGAAQPN